MLQVGCYTNPDSVLLVDGTRSDYDNVIALIQQLLGSTTPEIAVLVASTGQIPISTLVLRKRIGLNQISQSGDQIILMISENNAEHLTSRLQFPPDEYLPLSVKTGKLHYHHHYEYIEGFTPDLDPESLGAVFSLDCPAKNRPD